MRIPSPALSLMLLVAFPLFGGAQSQSDVTPELSLPERPHYVFQRVGEQLGLGSVTPSSILQDQLGFIWIGTRDGLLRYDGARVVRFGLDQGLPSTDVEQIEQAPGGRVWIVTRTGLAFYEGNALHAFKLPEAFSDLNGAQLLAVDRDGVPYLATLNGLLRLDPVKGKIAKVWDQGDGLPAAEVEAVTVGPDGHVWFGSDHRVGWLDAEQHPQFFPAQSGLPREKIVTILRDNQRVLWVRTALHLYRLDPADTHFVADAPDLPPANDFGRASLDRAGNLMIPSVMGLFRREGGEWELIDQSRGMFTNATFAITEDREGAYWIGLGGAGIQRWIGRKTWASWTQSEGLPDDVVWSTRRDLQKRLWVGTNNGLAMWDASRHAWRIWRAKDGLNGSTVREVAVASDGAIWALCFPGGLTRFDPVKLQPEKIATPEPNPTGIGRGPDGRIWIGNYKYLKALAANGGERFHFEDVQTPLDVTGAVSRITMGPEDVLWGSGHGGISRFDGHGWSHFTRNDGLMEDDVAEVAPVSANEIWFHYRDALGVSRLQIVNGKAQITHFGIAQGLPGLEIYMLGADHQGNIWAGGEHGLTEFVHNGGALRFTRSDGLIWNDLSAGGFFEEEDGTLLFGTSGGLARFNPFVAEDNRDVPPTVVITAAHLGSKNRLSEANPKATHEDNTFSVEFAALSYRDPENVRCGYQLQGLETEVNETVSRDVRYPALPPGHYRFDVACRSARGADSMPAHFFFIVEPAWWEEWYTRSGALFLGLIALIAVVRNRTKQLERERMRLEKAVEERSAELAEANRVLEEMTLTDPLTSVRNRRYFQVTIPADVGQTVRSYTPGDASKTRRNRDLIFYLIDADHFKEINDRFGHGAGDQVLIEMTRRISSAIRHSDVLVRWGGEEFLVVSRFTERTEAVALAARVLANVAREPFLIKGAGISLHRTCSIGWAAFPWNTESPDAVSYEEVLGLADKALYEAKHSGRNQAVGAVPVDASVELVGAVVGGGSYAREGKAGVAANYVRTPGIEIPGVI
jgi:diguanylate cyclase (GGDEF)-like protein